MKSKILLLLLATAITASVFAHGWGYGQNNPKMPNHGPRQMAPRGNQRMMQRQAPWQRQMPGQMAPRARQNFQRPAGETVTLSGNLIVAHGRPAIKSGDVTYFVGGLNRLTGFVDGLKEGAQVTIEGSALSRQKEDAIKFLMPTKLTLNGKTYDMAMPRRNLRNQESGERAPGNRQAPSGGDQR